jgi:glucose/arabinose dehydrogenase
MRKRLLMVVLWSVGVSVVASACSSSPTVTRLTPTAPLTPSPSALQSGSGPCAITGQTLPRGNIPADFATALVFAPDGRLFWTERSGTIKVWQDGAAHTFAAVKTATDGERGLLGLAISPTFTQDRFVYAFYSDVNETQQRVIRWRDCQGRGLDPTILVTLPAGPDCCHKGGRIAFGSDGMLYVTLGDEHDSWVAQNTADVRGKVLRYRPDGSIPPDNPFGATNPVWAYGLRNPFGIAVSSSGQIAITSNGPTGDAGSPRTGYDTLILSLTRGRGYQWPDCYGYSHPLAAASCPAGQSPPDYSSEHSTLVPTGAAFIDAAGPAPFAGHLVFCSLDAGMQIVTMGSPHASVKPGPSGCNLAVTEGPDHAVYFSDTTTIYRVN